MNNCLKVLGVMQVLIALVFIVSAVHTARNTSENAKQFAKTSRALAVATARHRDAYRQSAQNIFAIRPVLLDISGKTEMIGSTARTVGKKMGEANPFLGMIGRPIQDSGQHFFTVSAMVGKQAELLEQYEKSVFPQTVEALDEAAKAFEISAKTLDAMSDGGDTSLLVLSLLAGIFFLLNGVALIGIGFRLGVPQPRA